MLNVLITDDAMIIRKKINTYATNLGHKVIGQAKSGAEAVSMAKELKPDLITMDITMPDMNGIVAVRRIKEFDKKVKIIMVTSHGQEDMVVKSLKEGAKGYVLKPITEKKLSEAIGNIFPQYAVEDDDLLDD